METEERVVVEAHGLNAPTVVTVTVQDFPHKKHVLYQVPINLKLVNGILEAGTDIIKVGKTPASDYQMKQMYQG